MVQHPVSASVRKAHVLEADADRLLLLGRHSSGVRLRLVRSLQKGTHPVQGRHLLHELAHAGGHLRHQRGKGSHRTACKHKITYRKRAGCRLVQKPQIGDCVPHKQGETLYERRMKKTLLHRLPEPEVSVVVMGKTLPDPSGKLIEPDVLSIFHVGSGLTHIAPSVLQAAALLNPADLVFLRPAQRQEINCRQNENQYKHPGT